MSKGWKHCICEKCWNRMNPAKPPLRQSIAMPTECCYCGFEAAGDIIVRANPAEMWCRHATFEEANDG